VFSNVNAGLILGYSPEEVREMGDTLLSRIIHPDDQEQLAAHFGQLADSRESEVLTIRYRVLRKDGSIRWMESRDTCFKRTPEGKGWQILQVKRI
jgi:PAS domain S-box-containing protein